MKYILYTKSNRPGIERLYFVDTKWGAPSYFNHIEEAYRFDTHQEAMDAKEILDRALYVPEIHYIQEIK
ncbi:hypothetical protein BN80_071 [Yersinia phage phiR1-RT]|uniref:Uncharacterized protein n=1 Tax=Yersinia phage phiR1-RT TaxID=1206558 RepID=I7KR23_BPPR1|nr:hypothetical protein BN80_071 [Yersinia phage phiR1-RT]CCI88645.1 hypothetical protein BN80_071 [Yersinia phage phiR1-RT]